MNQNEFVGSLTPEQTAAFNAVLLAQREQLNAMYVATEAGLVATHSESLRILNENNAIIRKTLNEEVTQLKADLKLSQANETSINTRMARLLIELPFDPRLIRTDAFLDRIQDLIFTLAKLSSTDPVAQGFLRSLYVKAEANDSIKLDSPKLSGALEYLIEQGWLKPERADAITRDCTREESYTAV